MSSEVCTAQRVVLELSCLHAINVVAHFPKATLKRISSSGNWVIIDFDTPTKVSFFLFHDCTISKNISFWDARNGLRNGLASLCVLIPIDSTIYHYVCGGHVEGAVCQRRFIPPALTHHHCSVVDRFCQKWTQFSGYAYSLAKHALWVYFEITQTSLQNVWRCQDMSCILPDC